MIARPSLADLPPRLRAMIEYLLDHRAEILTPQTGRLELHFKGGEVTAVLWARKVLKRAAERRPPSAA